MAKEKCCGSCTLTWLSGFFAMPALMHLIRIIIGWPLTLAEHTFTAKESIVIIAVTGIFSAVLGIIGCALSRKSEGAAVC
jgi:ABC-type transporter Mla maintaining outer membrane lipid asymmetry permease subunit MlaE